MHTQNIQDKDILILWFYISMQLIFVYEVTSCS